MCLDPNVTFSLTFDVTGKRGVRPQLFPLVVTLVGPGRRGTVPCACSSYGQYMGARKARLHCLTRKKFPFPQHHWRETHCHGIYLFCNAQSQSGEHKVQRTTEPAVCRLSPFLLSGFVLRQWGWAGPHGDGSIHRQHKWEEEEETCHWEQGEDCAHICGCAVCLETMWLDFQSDHRPLVMNSVLYRPFITFTLMREGVCPSISPSVHLNFTIWGCPQATDQSSWSQPKQYLESQYFQDGKASISCSFPPTHRHP